MFGDRFSAFWAGIANPVDKFLRAGLFVASLLDSLRHSVGIGALLGIVTLVRRRSPYAFPLAVFPVVFPFLYYVTHTSLRYRHPIDPVVLLLAAIAVDALLRFLPNRRRSKDDLQPHFARTGRLFRLPAV